jgi:hypothetical protein
MFRRFPDLVPAVLLTAVSYAAGPPQAEISNQHIRAKLYLPDAAEGFYRSTRFDWSGVIHSLTFQGHDYYGPWFSKLDPTVRDFTYRNGEIVVGAVSAMTGPVDEFQRPLGYDAAAPGGTFVKIGVGVLRKPDATPYAAMKPYEIVDAGKWKVEKKADSVEFVQELKDASSGYGYVYVKTVRLTAGKPELVISHRLTNTGRLPIQTNVYNHNFLVLDRMPPGPDYTITVPFEIKSSRPPSPEAGAIKGNRITYAKALENQERLAFPIEGFGPDAKDYDFRIENAKAGVGMRITGDRPMSRVALWSIRSTLAVEPFLEIAAEPGKDFTWSYTYTYYALPRSNAR